MVALAAAGAPVNPAPVEPAPCWIDDSDEPPFTSALHLAVRAGAVDAVRALLQHGADPEISGAPFSARRTGGTPLQAALFRFDEIMLAEPADVICRSVVEALVEAGADVNRTLEFDAIHYPGSFFTY